LSPQPVNRRSPAALQSTLYTGRRWWPDNTLALRQRGRPSVTHCHTITLVSSLPDTVATRQEKR
jgi:hypothetical protein